MMSGVPPSRPPDNIPSSDSGGVSNKPPSHHAPKPFHLPPRQAPKRGPESLSEEAKKAELAALKKKYEEGHKEKHEEKKTKKGEKGLEGVSEPKLGLKGGDSSKEVLGPTPISSIAAKEGIQKISKLIQRLVENMRVGSVGGQQFTSLDLKKTPDIPSYFANATLTLTQTDKGLVIQFSNFESPQSQNLAIYAVENNKTELSDLMRSLQNKNINVAGLQLGDHSVSLPSITAPPPGEGAAYYERGGEGGGQGGGGQGEGEPRRDEKNKGER